MNNYKSFGVLKGKTLTAISGTIGSDEMIFTTSAGEQYKLFHMQDCCESVTVEDIEGSLDNLIGLPILQAEEVSNFEDPPWYEPAPFRESYTWTFYKLATAKGHVTIRWYGESNGYYSEEVDFCEL